MRREEGLRGVQSLRREKGLQSLRRQERVQSVRRKEEEVNTPLLLETPSPAGPAAAFSI